MRKSPGKKKESGGKVEKIKIFSKNHSKFFEKYIFENSSLKFFIYDEFSRLRTFPRLSGARNPFAQGKFRSSILQKCDFSRNFFIFPQPFFDLSSTFLRLKTSFSCRLEPQESGEHRIIIRRLLVVILQTQTCNNQNPKKCKNFQNPGFLEICKLETANLQISVCTFGTVKS